MRPSHTHAAALLLLSALLYAPARASAQTSAPQPKEQAPRGGVLMPKVDRRFVVLAAIARRDPARARTLAEGVAEERLREAEESKGAAAGGRASQAQGAEGSLGLAQSLLPVDRATALNLARGSFRFPANYARMLFLERAEARP